MSRGIEVNHTRKNRKNKARRRQIAVKRFMSGICAVVLIMICSFAFGNFFSSAHGTPAEEPVNYKYYTSVKIEKGDTLWTIAERYKSDEYDSIYDYMNELASLNSLNANEVDHLQEGTYLSVSYYDTDYK